MGDFVQKSVTRSATRALASPIESIAEFQTIVDGVITNNPFGCTSYQVGTETFDPVEKSREAYTARVVYQDLEAKTVGTVAVRSPTVAAYGTNVTTVMGNAPLATAMGGTAVHALEDDSFSASLKCHDPNGEVYTVAFTRDRVTISSYEDDAIRGKVEAWADTVPALA
ncbi:hypothetical protein DSECCO2_366150 [anaerobic digester metagenome]